MDIRTAAGGINDQTMRAAEALKRLQQLESLFPPSMTWSGRRGVTRLLVAHHLRSSR